MELMHSFTSRRQFFRLCAAVSAGSTIFAETLYALVEGKSEEKLTTAPRGAAKLAAACPNGIDVYYENVGGAVWQAVLPGRRRGAPAPETDASGSRHGSKGQDVGCRSG